MEALDIKLKLSEVQEALNVIPNINRGGCAIAALAMYRWLRKNRPYAHVKFILAYDSMNDFKINTELITNVNLPKVVAVAHAGIVVDMQNGEGPKVIDSLGPFGITQYTYSHIFSSEKMLLKAINTATNWNTDFNRKHVAAIAEVLDVDLSDVQIDYLAYAAEIKGTRELAELLMGNDSDARPVESAVWYVKNLWNLLLKTF